MIERFETFTKYISDLTRKIRRIKAYEMAKWNLKSQHVSCLYYLYERKSLTLKELCDICGADKANMSRSIEFLEANGFVKQQERSNKRYRIHFELTELGLSVGSSIFKRIEEIILNSSDGVCEEDRITMYKCLELINNNLKKITDEYN